MIRRPLVTSALALALAVAPLTARAQQPQPQAQPQAGRGVGRDLTLAIGEQVVVPSSDIRQYSEGTPGNDLGDTLERS